MQSIQWLSKNSRTSMLVDTKQKTTTSHTENHVSNSSWLWKEKKNEIFNCILQWKADFECWIKTLLKRNRAKSIFIKQQRKPFGFIVESSCFQPEPFLLYSYFHGLKARPQCTWNSTIIKYIYIDYCTR